MRRPLAITLAVTTALLVVPATAAADTVVARGTLVNAAGAPAAGSVTVYAWPRHGGPGVRTLPVIGRATAGVDGSFAVRVRDARRLRRLARRERGGLDLTAVGHSAGRTGEWTFTASVLPRGARGAHVVRVETAAGLGAAAASAPAPTLRLRAEKPAPAVASSQRCRNERQQETEGIERNWTLVGEVNNAYNDGTRARFYYARNGESDTSIGLAEIVSGVGASIVGETHISDSGRLTFPTIRRRTSRRLYTKFEYEKIRVRNNTCAVWDRYVRATSWIGGAMDRRQRSALGRCIPGALGEFPGGSVFHRQTRKATRWRAGVEAFGINLTTESGFSESVQITYHFGGPKRKDHYLCGANGSDSPYSSGRIFSGARQERPT